MPSDHGWKALYREIRAIAPEGEEGFEGLLLQLFEGETGATFYLARKGDQPVGDSFSPESGIILEAKLYTSRSSPSENSIEGEIDQALRHCPRLDVFIVATTKIRAQLVSRLQRKMNETGLDILLLQLANKRSELAALCVHHCDISARFLPKLGKAWLLWAKEESRNHLTKALLKRVRQNLNGMQTRGFVQKHCKTKLQARFQGLDDFPAHNRVCLSEAVSRAGLETKLAEWWQGGDPLAVLQGEEGMGKTWVAAAFSESMLSKEDSAVFWMDSASWCSVPSIENLVEVALKDVFIGDVPLCKRLHRKIFQLWKQPILLVLDGANESRAWESAARLLSEYRRHLNHLRAKVRILFTSRPLAERTGQHDFWNGCQVFQVGPFEPGEFRAALMSAAPGVRPETLTSAIREFAVIPRYLTLCIQLRNRLSSFAHINKQVLLWADLESKVASGDPQFLKMREELGGGPIQVLAHLAKKSGWPGRGGVSIKTEELQRSVPNFLQACTDLKEQRIVLDASFDITTLSPDHVILGWALVLRELAKDAIDPDDLRDLLQRELEPAASNDDKVRAVHVAAVLTFSTDTGCTHSWSLARAVMLGLWVTHHNASVSFEALEFFLRKDLQSYVHAIELLFRRHISGHLETTLIAPLAMGWREGRGRIKELTKILERWLRLVFPGDATGSKEGTTNPGSTFEKADTPEQLRLSYAAISVISFRPSADLLPALIDCCRSADFCYHDRPVGDAVQRLSLKSPHDPLGILLRWSYTERSIPQIVQLARTAKARGIGKSDILWFARMLRMSELPREIGRAKDIFSGSFESPAQHLSRFSKWLVSVSPTRGEVMGLDHVGALAVRGDLSLTENEREALIGEINSRILRGGFVATQNASWDNAQIHGLLPWLARYAPNCMESVLMDFWKRVLVSPESVFGLLDLDELLPANDLSGELVRSIIDNASALLNQKNYEAAVCPLTEVMLLHANLEQLEEWLVCLQDKVYQRGQGPVIGLLPLPEAFRLLAPPGLEKIARNRFEAALTKCNSSGGGSAARLHARHWLQVYAYCAESSREVGEWALSLLGKIKNDPELRFPIFSIVRTCSDDEVFLRALQHPALREYQLGFNSWRWTRRLAPRKEALSLKNLRSISLTVSGSLLSASKCRTDLRKWGRNLVEIAFGALKTAPAEISSGRDIEIHVDAQNRFGGFHHKTDAGGRSTWHDVSSSAWGIDRQTNGAMPSDNERDIAFDSFRADVNALRSSATRELTGFNAAGALMEWSKIDTNAFQAFARRFLPLFGRQEMGKRLEMSFFASCVGIALLRQNPKQALQLADSKENSWRSSVFCFDGALSWEGREIWSEHLNGSKEVQCLRWDLLTIAPNDEALFWHVAAALSCRNHQQIYKIAQQLLKRPIARDRALGVTLLAYLGDDASCEILNEQTTKDGSFWVRTHLRWAVEVCKTEIFCKAKYRQILRENSISPVMCGLAQMRKALSPMAKAWRHQVELDAPGFGEATRVASYLELFWYHWGNSSRHTHGFAIQGRKLQEYCRGEQLKEGVADRQHPWWQLHHVPE